ncbi:hypothetical protein KPH14_006391 [Odynerus spinipes]|uniref:Uncharacterized protein n=1 Tax=Odynerus spinipes TaxID=1348599 RepID=A0AAD9RZX9_9HYME|nr:hypothetical protein KPH14_006391 [Odynerus spinipes]
MRGLQLQTLLFPMNYQFEEEGKDIALNEAQFPHKQVSLFKDTSSGAYAVEIPRLLDMILGYAGGAP